VGREQSLCPMMGITADEQERLRRLQESDPFRDE
jgi:hypothetical protein